jgi:DNA replication protein DnaC
VKDASAIERAKAAIDAERVVLTGPAGVGKTVLGTCLLRAMSTTRGATASFVDAYMLGSARAQHELGAGEAPAVASAMRMPLLLLDDLGGDRPTVQSPIADVIFERHQRMRSTIVTTGFDLEAIRAKYGDGVARRVFEGAVVIALKPKGGG